MRGTATHGGTAVNDRVAATARGVDTTSDCRVAGPGIAEPAMHRALRAGDLEPTTAVTVAAAAAGTGAGPTRQHSNPAATALG